MIYLVSKFSNKPVRARCMHCKYIFKNHTGFLDSCSYKTNAKGERVDIHYCNPRGYSCEHFSPTPYWTIYSQVDQLTLF